MFEAGKRKGKTKKQIALMVEKRKHKEYRDLQKQKRLIKEINDMSDVLMEVKGSVSRIDGK